MSFFSLPLFLSTSFLLASIFTPVWADVSYTTSGVTCHKEANRVIIRFGHCAGMPIKETTLAQLDGVDEKELNENPLQEDGACTLADGTHVEIERYEGQAFGYGAGGADPEFSFTLKINDRPVYYKYLFYMGRGTDRYTLAGLIYDNGKLLACEPVPHEREDYSEAVKSLPCQDVSERLSGQALTGKEESEQENDEVRKEVEKRLSPFCRSVQAMQDLEYMTFETESPTVGMLLSNIKDKNLFAYGSADINNDSAQDLIVREEDYSRQFDGSFLIAFTKETEKFTDAILALSQINDPEKIPDTIAQHPEWKATFISLGKAGTSIRYVHNMPFILNDKIYIDSREANEENIPSRVISQIRPDNTPETLCEFP